MATSRYTVACPTCDAPVPIKNDSLVGKKVECPTCKARFVVPPREPVAADDAPVELTAAPAKKSKAPKVAATPGEKKPRNPKLLAGVGVGALAVLLLGVAGFFLLTGEEQPKPVVSVPRPVAQVTTPTTDRQGDADATADPGTDATEPGAEPGAEATDVKPKDAPKPEKPPSPIREVTNLLPGDTRAVYRVNHDTLSLQATPLYNAIFDTKIRDLFRQSMTFGSDQLATSLHAVVGPERRAFVLLRSKGEFDTEQLTKEMRLPKEPKATPNGVYYPLEKNPFVDAVAGAFSTRVLAMAVGVDLPEPAPAKDETRYALAVLDPRTVAIGEVRAVERYLTDLKPNGFPAYQSEPPAAPVAPPPPPADGEEPAEAKPAPLDPSKLTTTLPTYLTVDPPLKRLMNLLDDQAKVRGCVVYAETVDQSLVTPIVAAAVQAIVENERRTVKPVADSMKKVVRVGGTLDQFSRDRLRGQIVLEFISEDDAKEMATRAVAPALGRYLPAWDYVFTMQTRVFGNASAGVTNLATNAFGFGGGRGPGGGLPSGPGGGDEFGDGGGDSGGGVGGTIGGPGGSFPPGGSGSYPGGGGSGYPSGGSGSYPGGGSGSFPGSGGFGGGPSGYQPLPGEDAFDPKGAGRGAIELDLSDRTFTARFTLNWPDQKYATLVQPTVTRAGAQFRGRMGVYGGDIDWHDAATVAQQVVKAERPFPSATLARQVPNNRFGLAYPPEQRASFFVELLPFLGQGPLRTQVNEKDAWYAPENVNAAEAWVPELLVPYYPQESWRATNPLAPGRSLGGTNFVGIAGVGLDAARFDPANPEQAKKVGITGYNWSSKPSEITDGLSNTVYLAQVAPGGGRPWIAGGGATVLGVAEDDTALKPFVHKTPNKGEGAYVLMADGSVRFLSGKTDPKLFRAIVTRAGDETLTDFDAASENVPPRKAQAELKATPQPAGR